MKKRGSTDRGPTINTVSMWVVSASARGHTHTRLIGFCLNILLDIGCLLSWKSSAGSVTSGSSPKQAIASARNKEGGHSL